MMLGHTVSDTILRKLLEVINQRLESSLKSFYFSFLFLKILICDETITLLLTYSNEFY